MVSNALSQKSFSTKTPVICHPPPWPPIGLPPEIKKATFYVWNSLQDPGAMFPANLGGAINLVWESWNNRFYGYTQLGSQDDWVEAELRYVSGFPNYNVRLTWHWYPFLIEIIDWNNEQFTQERPYVGQQLSHYIYSRRGEGRAIVREIPT